MKKKIVILPKKNKNLPSGNPKKLFKEYQNHAKMNGFHLNPNKKIAERLIKSLIKREKKYGERYCPCRRVKGNKKTDEKNICPCVSHKEEIKKQGYCRCFLFVK